MNPSPSSSCRPSWTTSFVLALGLALLCLVAFRHDLEKMAPWSNTSPLLASLATVAGVYAQAQPSVDLSWHAPSSNHANAPFADILAGKGKWGYIYDSSETPDEDYGVYNWCNMPHVRAKEYPKASSEYELKYVELIHRHHKRTPYASNAFPVEPYQWNCDEQGLFYYGERLAGGHPSARTYWKVYISPVNPFVPAGWIGTCQFPQITAEGLDDSFTHGADLFGVYHDLLGLIPAKGDAAWSSKVHYRVTNNQITSQVAGQLVRAMYGPDEPAGLSIQAQGIDSLEPQFSCPRGSSLFNSIKSGNNPAWSGHLSAASSLYKVLDDIAGVPSNQGSFHASFDPYYDNLSARQCHDKPLPCKLVNGEQDPSRCITQDLADTVYRIGHWEYSQIYRDARDSLAASTASYGVWIAELATHLRAAVTGDTEVVYYHNVAHDGSVSRLLSILQADQMVWPGMGSEVVFELYQKKKQSPTATSAGSAPTETLVGAGCSRDNCLRQMVRQSASAAAFCPTFTAAATTESAAPLPTWIANCSGDRERISSACSCVVGTATSSAAAPEETPVAEGSGWFVRVLFGGQVFKSSSPTLGLMDMVPVETLLAYFDGLVGENASKVRANCA
ncbi:histidine phosphatase superfamily [Plectosphaerella plurivora]|uniref:Histidine phosphatase superfamily n=1 Tax=Plectosphaerella plurivora TaxID=936078 RepID=A0A9P9ABR8_9PEZI|nr:histidine phosphatase superfamily [Plectosphaerella plurivora]